jgi:hypothetical protein
VVAIVRLFGFGLELLESFLVGCCFAVALQAATSVRSFGRKGCREVSSTPLCTSLCDSIDLPRCYYGADLLQ